MLRCTRTLLSGCSIAPALQEMRLTVAPGHVRILAQLRLPISLLEDMPGEGLRSPAPFPVRLPTRTPGPAVSVAVGVPCGAECCVCLSLRGRHT